MGAYLSKPKTDIDTEEGGNGSLSFCAATMQGWRLNQEDAHNAIVDFDEDCSLFAVYDGHGGAEVSEYVSKHFPEFLKNLDSWKERDTRINEAFEDAFLGFDDKIRSPEVMKILSEVANEGKKKANDDDDEEELNNEKPTLYQEATLPLNKVLGNYGLQSSALISMLLNQANKRIAAGDADADDDEDEDEDEQEEGEAEDGEAKTEGNEADAEAEGDAEAKAEGNGEADADRPKKRALDDAADSSAKRVKVQEEKEPADAPIEEDMPGPSRAIVNQAAQDASSDSDESYNEDEEEDEEEEDSDEETIDYVSGGETPGDDSGTTACVAAIFKDKIVVANAGDTRAVLCRNGEAIDMSIDHKPEDELERTRILKAGGSVSGDGRVNGGLNLSRALGDHSYKKSPTLDLKEQMITSLPDVKTEKVTPDDQFLVVACDGIWNSMSSQEVVDFVKERLDNGGQLKYICEELSRHCLAPSTEGDGTGCDNITVIIIQLNTPYVPRPEENENNKEETAEEAATA